MLSISSFRPRYDISIDNIILENFKIFNGEHKLEFADINIITGGNNSGKSSLLEFITMLSKGFASSDFPRIDLTLPGKKRKAFDQLLNNQSSKKEIGFGFQYQTEYLDEPIEVRYAFIDGTSFGQENTMMFRSLKLFFKNKNVFSLFSGYFDSEFKEFYSSPNDDNNPGEFKFSMDIDFFSKLSARISNKDFSSLFIYLFNKFGDTWWGELFNEADFNEITYKLDLDDLILEFYRDREVNLADYDTREIIQYGSPETDSETEKYELLSKELQYDDFVKNVLRPFFLELKNHLRQLFYTILIKHDDTFQNVFIPFNEGTKYLDVIRHILDLDTDKNELYYYFYGKEEYAKFLFESLSLFDLNGIPEIKKHFDTGFTVDFVPAKLKSGIKDGAVSRKIKILKDHRNKVNLSEMGSGTWSVFSIILKTIASVIELDQLNYEDSKINRSKENLTSRFRKTIILQEPEAFFHPRWQSKLADFVVKCQNDFGSQFIIETHSEYFIRRIQFLTAQKKVKPEEVQIYYFSNPDKIKKGEQQIRSLHVREDGLMDDDFGEGFFDESTRLTIDLLKLQNQN